MLNANYANKNKTIMSDMLMGLFAMQIMAYYYYGMRTVIVTALSVLTCCAVDFLFVYYRKRDSKALDISPVVTGMAFAMLMPASIQYNILIASCVIMMVIGKHAFGGVKNPVFQTVAVGFAFTYLCWRNEVRLFPIPKNFGELSLSSNVSDSLEKSFTYIVDRVSEPAVSSINIMLGRFIGPMGATHIVILGVVAICLMFRRSISITTFFTTLITILGMAFLFPTDIRVDRISSVGYELVSGSMLFCLIFIASDLALAPKTRFGRFFYGLIIGLLTIYFRRKVMIEVPMVFAVVLANPLSGILDDASKAAKSVLKFLLRMIKKIPGMSYRLIVFLFRKLCLIPPYIAALIIKTKLLIEQKRLLKEQQKAEALEKANNYLENLAAGSAEFSEELSVNSADAEEMPVAEITEEKPVADINEEFFTISELTGEPGGERPQPLNRKKKSTKKRPQRKTIAPSEEHIQFTFDIDGITSEEIISEPEAAENNSEPINLISAELSDNAVAKITQPEQESFSDEMISELVTKGEQPEVHSNINILNIEPISRDKTLVDIRISPIKKKNPPKSSKQLKKDTLEQTFVPKKAKEKKKEEK